MKRCFVKHGNNSTGSQDNDTYKKAMIAGYLNQQDSSTDNIFVCRVWSSSALHPFSIPTIGSSCPRASCYQMGMDSHKDDQNPQDVGRRPSTVSAIGFTKIMEPTY